LENFLVDEDAEHVRVVVHRKNCFNCLSQGPERLFFVHACQETSDDEVHSLAVTDSRVPHHIATEDVSKRYDLDSNLFRVIKLREGALQVQLDLVEGEVRVVNVCLLESLVVTRVRFQLAKCS